MQCIIRFFVVVLMLLAAIGAFAVETVGKDVDPVILGQCKGDLARRFQASVEYIEVVSTYATVWPDTALGLPAIGELPVPLAKPGWRIILQWKNTSYLYTAGSSDFRYGGPVSLWESSQLYLQPIENEANLNGDLYQSSLLGTNSVRLVSGVADFYPQGHGVVIFTRRTSRSSHELWYVDANKASEPVLLHSSFAYGAAALNDNGTTWAAINRPMVGADWQVIVGALQETPEVQTLMVPKGFRPEEIAWAADKVMVLGVQGDETICYEINPEAFKAEGRESTWHLVPPYTFAGQQDYMLNKSETLEIDQVDTDGKPSVEVARVWFTGDRKVIAVIPGLTLREDRLVGAGYVFIRGEVDGTPATYTVSIATGEVIPSFTGQASSLKPFEHPPLSTPELELLMNLPYTDGMTPLE